MTTSDSLLRDVDARDRIRRLTAEYAHGLDGRDLKLFAEIWTEDAQWQPSPNFEWCQGKDQILSMAQKIFDSVPRTHHWVTNHVIDLAWDSGTGDSGTGESGTGGSGIGVSNMLSENLDQNGQWSRAASTHRDRYVQVDGRWYIGHRSCDIQLLG